MTPRTLDSASNDRDCGAVIARIAMISEHASPLATIGGVDAGGQNICVAHTARHLASLGCAVEETSWP